MVLSVYEEIVLIFKSWLGMEQKLLILIWTLMPIWERWQDYAVILSTLVIYLDMKIYKVIVLRLAHVMLANYSGEVYLIPHIYLGNIFPAVFCPPVLERQWNKYLNQHVVRDFLNSGHWVVKVEVRYNISEMWCCIWKIKGHQAIQYGVSNPCCNDCLQCDIIELALTDLICIASRSLSHTHFTSLYLSPSFPFSVPF